MYTFSVLSYCLLNTLCWCMRCRCAGIGECTVRAWNMSAHRAHGAVVRAAADLRRSPSGVPRPRAADCRETSRPSDAPRPRKNPRRRQRKHDGTLGARRRVAFGRRRYSGGGRNPWRRDAPVLIFVSAENCINKCCIRSVSGSSAMIASQCCYSAYTEWHKKMSRFALNVINRKFKHCWEWQSRNGHIKV